MDILKEIKQEHREIERELLELETIRNSEEINYPNLVYVFKKLCPLWDEHEEKEENFFLKLEKIEIHIPIEKILCEHKALKSHRRAIQNALSSESEPEIKKALHVNSTIIIEKLRKHMEFEDEILYRIVIDETALEKFEDL